MFLESWDKRGKIVCPASESFICCPWRKSFEYPSTFSFLPQLLTYGSVVFLTKKVRNQNILKHFTSVNFSDMLRRKMMKKLKKFQKFPHKIFLIYYFTSTSTINYPLSCLFLLNKFHLTRNSYLTYSFILVLSQINTTFIDSHMCMPQLLEISLMCFSFSLKCDVTKNSIKAV